MANNPKAKASDPKSRSSAEVVKKDGLNDTERFLNFGVPIELSFGKFTVQELDVVSLGQLSAGGLELLVAMEEARQALDGVPEIVIMQQMLMQPASRTLVGKIAAEYCSSDEPEKFERLKPKDFNTLWDAIIKVTDFEQIKKVFFNLGLHKFFQGLKIFTDDPKNPAQG